MHSSNAFALEMFFVAIVPGSSRNGGNTVNGLAFVGGNGSAVWVGPNPLGFPGGREVIASVPSHEIGHNLGLAHLVESFNLMQAGGAPARS